MTLFIGYRHISCIVEVMSSENRKIDSIPIKKPMHQNWYIRNKGKMQGPFPKGMIQSFVLSGRLKLGDEVSFDKDEWSKLKEHRELIPKELLNVKTEEDKERLRMAIRRENDRLHDRRTEQSREKNSNDKRRGDRRKAETDGDGISHKERKVRSSYKKEKKPIAQIMAFILFLSALAWLAYYVYSLGSKSVISITNCSSPAGPNVNWAHCKLEGYKAVSKNLSSGRFSNTSFIGADLHGSNFTGSNFQYSNLTQVNFSYADLSNTKLTGARLRAADLTNADLSGSDLSYTNLLDARLGGATLKNTRFDNAIWVDGRKCKTGSIGFCR